MRPHERVVGAGEIENAPLHLALVEPEIPPNTGNVARLCAATGAALHLVEPLGFRLDDADLKRAGLDYWEHLRIAVYPNLPQFLEDTKLYRRWFFSKRGTRPYAGADFQTGDMLVFGKETKGLPAELLAREPDRTLRIPMRANGVRSLNLSTAVGIAAYAALAKMNFPGLK